MNDPIYYFTMGIRCAKHVNSSDVADSLFRSNLDVRGSAAAALLALGLFMGASAGDDVDELLAALDEPAGVVGPDRET